MAVIAVVGAQWGDEGKGKIVDELSSQSDFVVRYQNGNYTGHRVIHEKGEFTFQLVPSGILYPQSTCIIGNGVVVDPRSLLAEIEQLQKQGVDTSRLFISNRAHLIMPYHILLDQLEEEARGTNQMEVTPYGIHPALVDKHARTGIRIADLLDVDSFRAKLASILPQKNRMITQIYGQPPLSLEEIHGEYFGYGLRLYHMIADTQKMLNEALEKKKTILLEGSQGALLDSNIHSTNTLTASPTFSTNASVGAGLPPRSVALTLGVYKAYTTRIGSGPMPTGLFDGAGEEMRKRGQEFLSDSGYERRCGWFDAVTGRFTARINGLDAAAITKLDVLDTFPKIKICTAYNLRGHILDTTPQSLTDLSACEPVYEEVEGWQRDTSTVSSYTDLPVQARAYIQRLEELLEIPIAMISVGPERGQTFHPLNLFANG